ncbi:MAG: N-acetyltransferase [Methylococcus sp.]|nr:MAG: N-acetyltransferase [Methylococcus sp.]
MTVSTRPYRILTQPLSRVDAASWNRLTDGAYPFLRHEFLLALEQHGCLGADVGWEPLHLMIESEAGDLLAAVPLYLKTNSFGEFVFDWAWADAYDRSGLSYYPKLVGASPFTPATGPRLLMHPDCRSTELGAMLEQALISVAHSLGVSSCHVLFSTDTCLADSGNFMKRMGCHFHWENRNYASFDDFLSALTSKRRKEILRERRQVREAGIELNQVPGNELTTTEWRRFHALYRNTFDRHGNYPALTLEFFESIAGSMGDQIRLVLARRQGEILAAAYFLVGTDCLYGRYWGGDQDVPGLHFEACYYQGIEYAIEHGLQRFEPGAQGEHKISRGFLPTRTWSHHWIAHAGFRASIGQFLDRETEVMERHVARLMERSPYKIA